MTDPTMTDESVREALVSAMDARMPVAIVVRGDVAAGRPARVVEGVPVTIEISRAGERVALEVIEGETLQKILLDRIERVLPASRAT